MRIKDLGTRPAPASIREFLSRMVRGQTPATAVQRRQIPYWQERGWTQNGNIYTGSYQTPFGAFYGHIDFYLYNPSDEIRSHSHWTCFQHTGNDWYLIHMKKQPRDVSSGIMTVERLVMEAYDL